jgi:hypothetical protein
MTRHPTNFADACLPTRTIRIVRGREIREVEMGSGIAALWSRFTLSPAFEALDRLMRERAAVKL